MSLSSINPTKTEAWKKLLAHFAITKNNTMQELFKNDATRADKFHIQWKDFLVDFSKNRIDSTTVKLLFELAEECYRLG